MSGLLRQLRDRATTCVSYYELERPPGNDYIDLIEAIRDGELEAMEVGLGIPKGDPRVVADEAVSLGGLTGREMRLESARGYAATIRVFVSGRRIYEVSVHGSNVVIGSENLQDVS